MAVQPDYVWQNHVGRRIFFLDCRAEMIRKATKQVQDSGHSESIDHYTPSTSNEFALAAHNYWHKRTNGWWACYVHQDIAVTCPSCGNVFKEDSLYCRKCGECRPGADDAEQIVAVSGKLLAYEECESFVPWGDVQSADKGAAKVRILFQHPLMYVWVEFLVKRLSATRFQVCTLLEQRKLRELGDRSPEQHDHDKRTLKKLKLGLIDTEAEKGCVSTLEIREGPARWQLASEAVAFWHALNDKPIHERRRQGAC